MTTVCNFWTQNKHGIQSREVSSAVDKSVEMPKTLCARGCRGTFSCAEHINTKSEESPSSPYSWLFVDTLSTRGKCAGCTFVHARTWSVCVGVTTKLVAVTGVILILNRCIQTLLSRKVAKVLHTRLYSTSHSHQDTFNNLNHSWNSRDKPRFIHKQMTCWFCVGSIKLIKRHLRSVPGWPSYLSG